MQQEGFMKTLKTLFLCLFLGAFTSAFGWGLKTGTYEMQGYNPSGGVYRGEVIIAPQGENYSVIWRIGSSQAQTGIGVYRDWDNVLSVAFADLSTGYWGVISYKVDFWGILDGKWASATGTSQGTEVLKWVNYSTY